MTKQEKIREGIYQVLDSELTAGYMADWERIGGELSLEQRVDYVYQVVQVITKKLASQGVVIKVDRGLPEMTDIILGATWEEQREVTYRQSQEAMLKAGYVAVEPLIQEASKID